MLATVELGLELLPLMRATAPRTEVIDTLRMVSLCASDLAHFEVALASAQEANRLAEESGDQARLSMATNVLACFFERIGDPWHAERLMLEALAIARGCGQAHPPFVALNNLCGVLVGAFYMLRDSAPVAESQAALERALPYGREAMALALQTADDFFTTFVQSNLGEILLHLGQIKEAEELLTLASDTARGQGFEAIGWRVGFALGELRLRQQRPADAHHLLHTVLAAATPADPRAILLRVHHALWRAARALGRPDEALLHLEHCLKLERERSLNQLRGQSQLFITRVEGERVRLEVKRERQRAVELEADARRDQLTGLGNRRELELRWPELLQHARAAATPLAVAMIDLDAFKAVNDRFGHAVGDAVLVALAHILRANIRADDLVARMGGEEFLLVLPDAGPRRALEVCERLRQRVASHGWELVSPGLQVTLSVGLTNAPPLDLKLLMQRADDALYEAKRSGRNRVVVR